MARLQHIWSLCSKCPPCARSRTQAPRRWRHCLTALSMTTWGMFPLFDQGRLRSAGRRHVAAVHTILQLPPNLVVDWVFIGSGLLAGHKAGVMKSGVSWVNKYTVLRALWAGSLSAWLQHVTLYWKLKYFVVNIWILITRVINIIFLWNLEILSQIYS